MTVGAVASARRPRPRLRGLRQGGASLVVFSAAAVGAGLGRALVTTYLPVLLADIRDTPGLIGMVMLVNTAAGFAVPLWIGFWSDSLRARGHGRTRPFILGGSAVGAGGLVAIALGHASSYLALALFAAIVYTGLNAITTAHRALIPETFGERARGTATGAEELALLAGTLLGVVVGGVLLEVADWVPFAFGAFALPLLALPTVRRMRGRETAGSPRPTTRAPLSYYLRAAGRPGVRLVLAAQTLWVLGYVGLPPFFVLYADRVLDLRPSVAAALLGAFGLVTGVSVLAAGAVAPHRQAQSLALGVLLMGGGLLGVAATTTLRFVAPTLLAAAVGFGLVTTLGFTAFMRFIPRGEEGAYSALFFSTRSIASAVAVPAAGWSITLAHTYRAIFVLGGAVTLLALVPLSLLASAQRPSPRWPRPRALAIQAGMLVAATTLALAAGLVSAESRFSRIDESLFDALFELGSAPAFLDAALVDPHIQNYVGLTLLAAATAAVWRRAQLGPVLALVPFAGLLAFGLVRLLWVVWERARPEEILGIDPANGHVWAPYPSFPSGHVVVTVALIAAITSRLRVLAIVLWPYAALIGLTRVVYGAHFPSDVLFGAVLGYVAARVAASLLEEAGLVDLAWPRRHARIPAAPRLRLAAQASAGLAVAGFLILAVTVGPPHSPEGGVIPTDQEQAIQLALVLLAAVGIAVSPRHEAIAAACLALAGVALGVLAAVEYAPAFALGACLALFVPAVLLLGSSRAVRSRRGALAAGAAALVTLVAGGLAAAEVHARAYGPTHPESSLQPVPISLVRWSWAGAVTPRSVRVTAKLARDTHARLVVGTTPSLVDGWRSGVRVADHDRNDRIVSFRVTGLAPATRYHYAISAHGTIDRSRFGSFRTLPVGPSSFTVAFGACARVGSNGAVFDAIRARRPLLFLALGDLFYGNVDAADPEEFRNLYDRLLGQPAPAALFRSVPLAYVWDDHDYGANDADGTSPSREAAQQTYRALVPHYPLAAGRESGPIYQAFTIGHVRFLLTDTRSERAPADLPDGPTKSMLGSRQKAWLKHELALASERRQLIVWANSVPWITRAGADSWAGYATERRELANFIAARRIRGLVMLSGDAHMLAIDDGSHSDFSTVGDAGFPVIHAAALDRRGEVKGGPYSEGAFPGSGQFGTLTVHDRGGSQIGVQLDGWDYRGRRIVSYGFRVDAEGRR